MGRSLARHEYDAETRAVTKARALIAAVLLGLGLLPAAGCSWMAGDSLSLGRAVIREPADWWSRTNQVLSVYSRRAEQLDAAFDKLHFSHDRAAALIGLDPKAVRPVYCYLLDDEQLWADLSAKYVIHSNTVSLTSGNEMICLVTGTDDLAGDALPHELIHVLIRQSEMKLPLALEEGMALYFGWEINLEYHLSRGAIVQKKKKVLQRESLLAVDELFQVTSYPKDNEALETFYVQSERCVRAINELIGTAAMPEFLRQVGQGDRPWRTVLANSFSCGSEQLAWVEQVTSRPSEQ